MALFKIAGVNNINKVLQGLPKNVARKALRQAMRPAMKIIQAGAKEKAPVETGLTKKAIKVKAMKRTSRFIGIDVVIGEGDYKGKTFYGSFIEFGTSKMAPKPFMKPVFIGKGPEARAYAMKRLRELVMEAKAKI